MAVTYMKSIEIESHVFEKLQGLATPLVDDANSVIEKLIVHWESTHSGPNPTTPAAPTSGDEVFMLSRGEKIRVGLKLRARYKGRAYEARVTQNGIEFENNFYDSPSAAGIAAKRSAGAKGSAANTNGWGFWKYYDERRRDWFSLKDFS